MSFFNRLETFAYKHVFVPRQGKHTFDFIGNEYSKGEKVIDFGSGLGTNSKLFSPDDYIGLEINKSRVAESNRSFPDYNFQVIPLINTENDRLKKIINSTSGFLYMVSVFGTTGVQTKIHQYTIDLKTRHLNLRLSKFLLQRGYYF